MKDWFAALAMLCWIGGAAVFGLGINEQWEHGIWGIVAIPVGFLFLAIADGLR